MDLMRSSPDAWQGGRFQRMETRGLDPANWVVARNTLFPKTGKNVMTWDFIRKS